MKLSATRLATILFTVLAAVVLASPAEARSKKPMSANDLACKGILEICYGICEATHVNDVGTASVNGCFAKCESEYNTCRRRDDIAMTTSLSSSNSDVFSLDPGPSGGTPGTGGNTGTGGGGGGGMDGTHGFATGGVSANPGGAATIY